MTEEEIEEDKSSITVGTPAKGGAYKVYFNINKPIEDVKTDIDKALKVLDYLRKLGFCRGE